MVINSAIAICRRRSSDAPARPTSDHRVSGNFDDFADSRGIVGKLPAYSTRFNPCEQLPGQICGHCATYPSLPSSYGDDFLRLCLSKMIIFDEAGSLFSVFVFLSQFLRSCIEDCRGDNGGGGGLDRQCLSAEMAEKPS
jgi:hypothetical protein